MKSPTPEVWLRGPLPDLPQLLQPVAHALLQAREEIQNALLDFPEDHLFDRPADVASVGFHLKHLRGVLDRMATYARGEDLNATQFLALDDEQSGTGSLADLRRDFEWQVDSFIEQLRDTDATTLTDTRTVGRQRLPSTHIGLLFHAAEHTTRHAGQLLVTAAVVRKA